MDRSTPGPLLGVGRDCDVFDIGANRVLRRYRNGRSSETEALTMAHVRRHGYPAPEVFDADGPDLVIERIVGPTMVDAAAKAPWKVRHYGAMLADLATRLSSVPIPTHTLNSALGEPEVLAHLDLHPLNVMIGSAGPVVIDWPNAALAPRGVDSANTWLTIAAGQTGDNVAIRFLIDRFRGVLLKAFLGGVDRDEARRGLDLALGYRLSDTNLSAVEQATMTDVAHRAK